MDRYRCCRRHAALVRWAKRNHKDSICFGPCLLARNLVARRFNKIKQCRGVATRHDKLAVVPPISVINSRRFIGPPPRTTLCTMSKTLASCDRAASEKRRAIGGALGQKPAVYPP